jgi:O-antigen/teichoic acid export membrane protein
LATSLLANTGLGVLGLLSSSVAGWTFGPAGRGQLAALQVTSAIVGLVAAFGLPDAVVYFLSSKPDHPGAIIGTATRVVAYSSVAVTLAAIVPVMFLLGRYDGPTRRAGLVLVAVSPVLALTNVFHQALRGLQLSVAWNLVRLLGAGIWLLAIVAVAVTSRHAPTAALWYAALLVPMFVVTRRAVKRAVPEPFVRDRALRPRLLRFAAPSVVASIPLYLNLRLDQVVLTRVATPRDLGLYAAAAGFTWAVNPPLQAIASLAFPKVAGILDPDAQRTELLRITRLTVPVCVVTALVVGGLTPLAIPLLNGPSFRAAISVAIVLVGASTIFAYEYILEEAARGLGQPRLALIAQMTGLASTIVALAVLIPRFGILGAAWASVCGYGAACCTDLLLLRRHLHCSFSDLLVPSLSDLRQARTSLLRRG